LVIRGDKPIDRGLLMLINTPDFCQRHLKLFIHPRTKMLKAKRLYFKPIHKDNSQPA
jgi:hypothetical protein